MKLPVRFGRQNCARWPWTISLLVWKWYLGAVRPTWRMDGKRRHIWARSGRSIRPNIYKIAMANNLSLTCKFKSANNLRTGRSRFHPSISKAVRWTNRLTTVSFDANWFFWIPVKVRGFTTPRKVERVLKKKDLSFSISFFASGRNCFRTSSSAEMDAYEWHKFVSCWSYTTAPGWPLADPSSRVIFVRTSTEAWVLSVTSTLAVLPSLTVWSTWPLNSFSFGKIVFKSARSVGSIWKRDYFWSGRFIF